VCDHRRHTPPWRPVFWEPQILGKHGSQGLSQVRLALMSRFARHTFLRVRFAEGLVHLHHLDNRAKLVVQGKQVKPNRVHVMQGMREFAPRGPIGYRCSIDNACEPRLYCPPWSDVSGWAKHPTKMGNKDEARKH
jgi:hypothetical protein